MTLCQAVQQIRKTGFLGLLSVKVLYLDLYNRHSFVT